MQRTDSPFGHLLMRLYTVLHEGVTTYLESFHRYLVRDINFPPITRVTIDDQSGVG